MAGGIARTSTDLEGRHEVQTLQEWFRKTKVSFHVASLPTVVVPYTNVHNVHHVPQPRPRGRTTLDELFIGYRRKSLLSGRPRTTEACGTLHLSFPIPAGSNQTPRLDGIPRINHTHVLPNEHPRHPRKESQ